MRTLTFESSSNLKSAELRDDGVCVVTFANGQTASYLNITEAMLEEWKSAPSAGRWFHQKIRSKPADFPAPAVPEPAPGGAVATAEVKDEPATPEAPKVTDEERVRWADKIKTQTEQILKLQHALKLEQARADKLEEELKTARAAAKTGGGGTKPPWKRRGRRF